MSLIYLLIHVIPGKVAAGVAEAFSAFYECYLPRVLRYVTYKVSDPHLAEDITSAVFEKALTKFSSYRSEKASFATWIFSIARNTLIDHFRVNARQATVPLDTMTHDPEDGDATPEETLLRKEKSGMLQRCIAGLSPREQEIISLKFGAEMNNRQIADALGLSDSNVGIILYRAIRKLREDYLGCQDG